LVIAIHVAGALPLRIGSHKGDRDGGGGNGQPSARERHAPTGNANLGRDIDSVDHVTIRPSKMVFASSNLHDRGDVH
jgi:hypothetical protein